MKTPPPLRIDARPLLARGLHPLQKVLSELEHLAPGQDLLLEAPFRPDPLIAVLAKRGYEARVSERGDGIFEIQFSSALGNRH